MSEIKDIKILEFIKQQAMGLDQLTSAINEYQEKINNLEIKISGLSEIVKVITERQREMEKCFGN